MYPPPPAITTRVFARLPDTLRAPGGVPSLEAYYGARFDSFLEGPSFDRAGNLYCVDIVAGRILRVRPDGAFELVLAYDGMPNGLKVHRDGRLFVADRRRGIVSIDPAAPELTIVLPGVAGEPFRGLNDLVFTAGGDLYFTDQGASDIVNPNGRVFRLGADGGLQVVLDGLPGPNGIAIDPSGRLLHVALTRTNRILNAMIAPNGQLARASLYLQMSGGVGPDGIAFDAGGGLAICHPGSGAAWLFDDRGRPTLRIDLCEGRFGSNLAFGGDGDRQLFITESETGTIQVADLPRSGLALYSHRDAD